MKDYIEEIRVLKTKLIEYIDQIKKNSESEDICFTICCHAQQEMIDLGTLLEKEINLEESKIIHWLEMACEFFYLFSNKEITADDLKRYMVWHFEQMERNYYQSIPKQAHELSIVSIIKNERNIREWIEYHLLVGVSHLYIYDNESTDNLKEKLQPYIEKGVVTYIYFPGKCQQFAAYNHAINFFKYETKWMAMIDGDEYIVPVKEGTTLPQVINEIEQNYMKHPMRNSMYSGVGAIGINWRVYGTSGHKKTCNGLIIENYNYRAEDDYFQNVHIKSIYNPRVVMEIKNPHFGYLHPDWICISEKGSYIPGPFFYDSRCEKLRINHYFSKSEEELLSKNQRGWPDGDLQRDDSKELYEAKVNCNKVYDPIMERYIEGVKGREQNSSPL